MSGGFFRGTSADQDTRFSNKQAKLLKSQKFAPELDHLVDIRKVKMDVVKPWIATRVTEFLGFEDEVLINFIYGLLEGKEINGKEVQIQLTGFMEKNTGKFMKELWNLLRSAEQNASGVPQQFLDAKEEEIKNKKEEADRITLEIQKKRDIAQEKAKEMDGEVDKTRSQSDGFNPLPKRLPPIGEEDIASEERNGLGGKNRKQSRSMSRSPPRRRSISPDRRYRSPNRRSISPRRRHSPRRYRSPLRRRSPYSRRRSTSRSRRKSPSPVRRRSPFPARRRSPSPARRRSPSPVRRRSPISLRRRSPSPSRRSSPSLVRRRSPSPVRRRSPPPMRRRSPSPRRRRSPSPFQRRSRRRSPSPRRRSPSPFRRRSPSPLGSISPPRRSLSPISPPRRSLSPISPKESKRSPLRSPQQRNRSRSPYRSRSPVRSRSSLSRDREIRTNGVGSKRTRDDYPSQRSRGKRSPVRHTPEREEVEMSDQERKALDSVSRRPPVPSRSPHRDPKKQSGVHHQIPVRLRSPEKSPSGSESPPHMRKVISRDGKRTSSPSRSPVRVTQEQRSRAESASPVRKVRDQGARHRGSPETSEEEDNSHARRHVRLSPRKRTRSSPSADAKTNVPSRNTHDEKFSPADSGRDQSGDFRSRHADDLESRKKDHDVVGHGKVEAEKSELDGIPDEQPFSKKRSRTSNIEGSEQGDKLEALQKPTKRVDHQIATSDSGSEESEKYRIGAVDKRKQKKSERHQMASGDDVSDDSEIDTKKDAKRRRKEEKRLRKEEKRRRREERHRKKEERRAGRQKTKIKDTAPLDIKNNQKFGDDDIALRTESNPSDTEEDIDPKQHEIELRKKALESLKRKKAINS